jgi:archaellum component FlaG (FlaF/FlaG flagellin family)
MDTSKKGSSVIFIIAIVIGCAVVGIISQKYLGSGNEVEKISEEIIEHETGFHIDLDMKQI